MGKRRADQSHDLPSKSKRLSDESKLLVDPEKPWYLVKIKETWEITGPRPDAAGEIDTVLNKAIQVYESQVRNFRSQRDISRADKDWLDTVVTSGTASDKASAFLLQIQEAPIFSGEFIKKLVEMAKSKSRHESELAVNTLLDAFKILLPPAEIRPLHYVKQRKWEHPGSISDRTLFVCQFEDIVKRSFFEYLKVLEIMLQDQIAHSRSTAMRLLSQLLNSKDEQANNMISMMANKLGDPDKKIASRVVYYLQELINSQPKAISKTVAYIEQVILRPGMKEKAQYYGVTFLSQIMLSHETPDITDQILKIYVALMKNTILPSLNFTSSKDNTKRKNKKVTKVKLGMATESDIEPATSRLAKIILVGFGRALPFCKHPEEFVNDLSNPIQTLMSHANFSTVMQALNLYFTMATTGSDIGLNEMFIKAVDKVLSRSEILTVTSSHPQLIATVFKIVSHPDLNIVASHAVIKSLFRLVFKVPSSAFVLAVLLLFLEVLKTKGSLKAMFNMPGDVIESNNLQEYTSSSLWELHALCSHQDAKIQGLAKTILKGELAIEGLSANPFENQSVSNFLINL